MKRMWEKIREEMLKYNYNFSINQIENKWKSLERSYKTVIENKNKTGRGRKGCPYERELGEILDKRHSVNPICVLDSSATTEEASDTSRSATPESSETPKRPSSRSNQNTTALHDLKQLRLLIAEGNKKREEMEERKFHQRQQIIEQLKIKNELLSKLIEKSREK